MSDIKDILEDAQKHSATDGEKFVVIGEESWQALVKYAEGESSSPPEQFESESSIHYKWDDEIVLKPQVAEGRWGLLPWAHFEQLQKHVKFGGQPVVRIAHTVNHNVRVELHPIAVALTVRTKANSQPVEQRRILCSRHAASIRAFVEDACKQVSIAAADWRINSVSVCLLEPLSPPAPAADWDYKSERLPKETPYQLVKPHQADMHPDEVNWPRMIALRIFASPQPNSSNSQCLWPTDPPAGGQAHPPPVGGTKRPLADSTPANHAEVLPILPSTLKHGSKRARSMQAAAASGSGGSGPSRGSALQASTAANGQSQRRQLFEDAGGSSSGSDAASFDSPSFSIPRPRTTGRSDLVSSDSDADSGIDTGGRAHGSARIASQLDDDGDVLPRSASWGANGSLPAGCTGLSNMGNTCFMNAALQCLSNTPLLTAYLLRGGQVLDVNRDNPLGHNGRIIMSFAKLVRSLWAGGLDDPPAAGMRLGYMLQRRHDTHRLLHSVLSRKGANGNKLLPSLPPDDRRVPGKALATAGGGAVAPGGLKYAIATAAPQFGGYQQHDSQELLAFLLDGLHEDVNKITKKPYVEVPSGKEGKDSNQRLAADVWAAYAKRNDSIITQLFQGQYRSRVQCVTPGCSHVSLTFDPYSFLSLPLPAQQRYVRFDCTVLDVGAGITIARGGEPVGAPSQHIVPQAHSLLLPQDASVLDAMKALAKELGVVRQRLLPVSNSATGVVPLALRAPAPCVGVRDEFDGTVNLTSLGSLGTTPMSKVLVYKLPQHVLDAADADIAAAPQRKAAATAAAATSEGAGAKGGVNTAHQAAASTLMGFAARSAAAFGALSKTVASAASGFSKPFVDGLVSTPSGAQGTSGRLSLEPKREKTESSNLPESDSDTHDDDSRVEHAVGSVDSTAAVEHSQSPSAESGSAANEPSGEDDEEDTQLTDSGAVETREPVLWRFVMLQLEHRQQQPATAAALSRTQPMGYPAIVPVVVASQEIDDEEFKALIPSSVHHLPRLSSREQLLRLVERWVAPLQQAGAVRARSDSEKAPTVMLQTSSSFMVSPKPVKASKPDEPGLWDFLGCRAPEALNPSNALRNKPRGVFGMGNGFANHALPPAAQALDGGSSSDSSTDLFGSSVRSKPASAHKSAVAPPRWQGMRNFINAPTVQVVWQISVCAAVQRLLRPLLPPGDNAAQPGETASAAGVPWPTRIPRAPSSDKTTAMPDTSVDGITLTDCMQMWESEEQLGDADTWYCSECKQHVRALKRLSLWSAPQYLMVHLKRFKFNTFSRARINTRVHFPISGWDLSQHFLEPEATVHAHGSVYDLYAVINHMGGMGGGHYTACAKHPLTDMWYDFDDSSVSQMGPSSSQRVQTRLTSSQAYVLFYARRVPPQEGAATE